MSARRETDALPRVEMLEEVGSTNEEAQRRAAGGDCGPLWIATRRQTGGKGRAGRAWTEASAGNVAATLLFEPGCPSARLPELSLVAGVAAHDAITAALPGAIAPRVKLKWPNDVLIQGAKTSGILIESCNFGASVVSLIGTGINVASAPSVTDRAVTCLVDHGCVVSADEVLDLLVARTAYWLAIWSGDGSFDAIREAWTARATAIGSPLEVKTGSGAVAGVFAGLDRDGALLIDLPSAGRQRFTFGDVSVLSPQQS